MGAVTTANYSLPMKPAGCLAQPLAAVVGLALSLFSSLPSSSSTPAQASRISAIFPRCFHRSLLSFSPLHFQAPRQRHDLGLALLSLATSSCPSPSSISRAAASPPTPPAAYCRSGARGRGYADAAPASPARFPVKCWAASWLASCCSSARWAWASVSSTISACRSPSWPCCPAWQAQPSTCWWTRLFSF